MTKFNAVSWALAIALAGCVADLGSEDQAASGSAASARGGNVRGAIFTTTIDGGRVDANLYPSKDAVYLDGGPGDHAPSTAAALPAGDYYFQVTDPSGHMLLSQDPVECRRVRVSTDGVIVHVYGGPNGCRHAQSVDKDHAALGAITVQLMPYADTPNHGGEYKAWVTPVERLAADGSFVPRYSKTDNFKVREQETPPPPPTPCCGNGIVETGEQCDDGNTTSGDGCSSTCQLEQPPVCDAGVH